MNPTLKCNLSKYGEKKTAIFFGLVLLKQVILFTNNRTPRIDSIENKIDVKNMFCKGKQW